MSKESPILTRFSLSPQQQGMFFETEISDNPSLHLEQSVWRIEGLLDINRFKECWQTIHDHHNILRTCFSWNEHTPPVQIVLKPFKIRFQEYTTAGDDREKVDQTIEDILSEGSKKGFKLNQPPLSRFSLITVSDTLHYLIWEHHHILLDGWSVQLIANDLMSLYRGGEITVTRQYDEYVAWLEKQNHEQAEIYWKGLLNNKNYSTTPGLIVQDGHDHHSEAPTEKLIRLKWETDINTTGLLRVFAKKNRVTLNHLIKAIWALLLSKWNQSENIGYGVTVSGRPYQLDGSGQMTGLFINTVPETLHVSPDGTLSEIAEQVKDLEFEREDYEFYTAGLIHQWSGFPGSKPLFESLLVFDEYSNQEEMDQNSLHIRFEEKWYRGGTTSEPVTLLINAGSKLRFESIAITQHLNHDSLLAIKNQFMQLISLIAGYSSDQSVLELHRSLSGNDPVFSQTSGKSSSGLSESEITLLRDDKMFQIWREVLGTDQILPNDNFFELGGHSLLAIKIANRIRDHFNVEIPLKNLFQNPTLTGMSEQVNTIRRSMDQILFKTVPVTDDNEEGEL